MISINFLSIKKIINQDNNNLKASFSTYPNKYAEQTLWKENSYEEQQLWKDENDAEEDEQRVEGQKLLKAKGSRHEEDFDEETEKEPDEETEEEARAEEDHIYIHHVYESDLLNNLHSQDVLTRLMLNPCFRYLTHQGQELSVAYDLCFRSKMYGRLRF